MQNVPALPALKKKRKKLILIAVIVLGVFAISISLYYRYRYIDVYQDTANSCGWQNASITSGTLVTEDIKTIRIHRSQRSSFFKHAELANECVGLTPTIY